MSDNLVRRLNGITLHSIIVLGNSNAVYPSSERMRNLWDLFIMEDLLQVDSLYDSQVVFRSNLSNTSGLAKDLLLCSSTYW